MPDRTLHPGSPDEPTGGGASPGSSVIELPGRKSPANIEIGTSLGPYKILQQLGEGGFGFVYLAEQSEPVRRKVALKILKLGMDTHQVIARFEAERQALAMMDHPNIAKVLDAGATETGRPYFVMELVKGIPITQYCDENRLAPKERLVLFMLVCNAVQHAHTKGIIHRDLKPSNIMITMQDGKPVPKVIDFGIAKAIDQKLTDKTVFTEYHQLIGTPEYMSPEQAQMSGIDIDTRSDVYSLGVLLYELLTGTTPFDAKELRRAGYGEIQRIIREVDPPRPSTRMTELISMRAVADKVSRAATMTPGTWNQNQVELGDKIDAAITESTSAQGIARSRRTEPAGLCKLLRGDLDWITMKALEKDRTRRYETASAFEMDVLKYLCDETVSASPPSVSYKVWKFVRRHRTWVSLAAVILVTLIAGVATSTILAIREAAARADALKAKAEAEKERDDALRARADAGIIAALNIKGSDERLAIAGKSLEIYQRLGLDREPETAVAMFALAGAAWDSDDHAGAELRFRQSIDLLRSIRTARGDSRLMNGVDMLIGVSPYGGMTSAVTVQGLIAQSLENMAQMFEADGNLDKAIEVRRELVREIQEHPATERGSFHLSDAETRLNQLLQLKKQQDTGQPKAGTP